MLQASVEPLTGPVVGDDTGTTVVLDELPGSTTWNTLTWVLAALSLAAVAGGIMLARLWRPKHSLEQLRSAIEQGERR